MDLKTEYPSSRREEKQTSAFVGKRGRSLWRWASLFLLMLFFATMLILSLQSREPESVVGSLGIPILSDAEMAVFRTYVYRDFSENLKYQDDFAPVDEETSTIYLSQQIHSETTAADLTGQLTIDYPGRSLFFAPDECWQNLSHAVRSGHRFKLLVSGPQKTYMQYDVVFTTLPVMSLYGQLLYKDADMVETFSGRAVLWDSRVDGASGPVVTASQAQWHKRGGSSSYLDKEPWKLNLKNLDNRNKSEELLGLGSDDDWILNPMNMEDSNVREKLFMDLWNRVAEETSYNEPMSVGEYTEILVNGEYRGLYLLQRRVDDRYLELDENDVLVKAKQINGELLYEFYAVGNGQLPQDVLDAFFVDLDCSNVNVHNFVDVSLFLQLFSAADNYGYKNMYYLFSAVGNGYEIRMIPWDTDLSMGSVYSNELLEFVYDYETTVKDYVHRREMKAMQQQYPQLKELLSRRWKELRKGVIQYDRIAAMMDHYLADLEDSGADVRDQEKWGLFYNGEDTIEKLYQFVNDRLLFLDEYYA